MALTCAALYPDATTRCIAIVARAVGEDEQGEEAEREMEQMLARHQDAPVRAAGAVWDAWTERALAATDAAEIDAIMAEVLPLYTADPSAARAPLHPGVAERGRERSGGDQDLEDGLWETIDVRPLLADVRCPTPLGWASWT